VQATFAAAAKDDTVLWRATLSGVCANLVGIGLARFAYTPLIPALILAGWFSPAQAAYLGAANLGGYLAGALLARPLAARVAPATLLRAAMLLTAASFPASAYPLSFAWFFAWRFAAGFGGGALMVVAAPVILQHAPVRQRGIVAGVMFAGVGLGIAASGTLVALLLRYGLAATWNVLGIVALLLTAVAWNGWPQAAEREAATPVSAPPRMRPGAALTALHIGYGLGAVGLVPPMVFLVDFIARANHLGLEAGAHYWTLFGIAAIAGPVLLGSVADRIGFHPTLRATFILDAGALVLLALTSHPAALALSVIVLGASVPGVVPLAVGRVHELVHVEMERRRAWTICTVAFAVGQAVAAYGFSYLFAKTSGAYVLLFGIGAGAFALALLIDLAVAIAARRASQPRCENARARWSQIPACNERTKAERPGWRSRFKRSAPRMARTSSKAASISRLITT
jgi:predicted MFS family arabinose efflux permease